MEAFTKGQPTKEQQPFLWVNVHRLLGAFHAEESLRETIPDALERGMAYYQVHRPTSSDDLGCPSPRPEEVF